MTNKVKIKTATFRYIESEIYAYFETKERIELLKYEIRHRTSNNDENVGAGKNSVRSKYSETEEKATAVTTDVRIARLQEKASAIEKVYNSLVDEKKEVMKLYYWDRPGQLTWEGVAKETHTSRATALRWRKQFVIDIAKELGEL